MTDQPIVDRAIAGAKNGTLTMQTVLWTFAAATVCVPSGADPGPDRGGMRPVYYAKGETQMMAVFTSPVLPNSLQQLAPYLVTFAGEDVIARLPAGQGLVVNPGYPTGFEIEPAGLDRLRQELSAQA